LQIKELLENNIESVTSDLLKDVLGRFLLNLAPSIIGTFWGGLVLKVVGVIVDKFIMPALEDYYGEVMCMVRAKELDKKVEKYVIATSNEEIDTAFDDLLSGSKFK
jgi:hypothetical protein